MGSREERRGLNEAVFRQVNERIADLGDPFAGQRLEIICECASLECVERIELARADYERARQDETTFIVLAGHVDPAIESAVARQNGYVFVRKHGDAADVAAATDPR